MTIPKKMNIHPTNGMVIRYKGIFDIDHLYKSVKSWFNDYSYDYFEREHKEKVKPEGNSVKIRVNAEREVDDYVKFRIEVDFVEILKIRKVEKGGYYGDARIVIRAFMEFDYHNKWKNFPFLFYVYNNFILKKKIWNFYWVKIYNEMMELNSLIKSKLGLIK